MRLRSDDFKDGQAIPFRFTCDGENVSPHLAWSDPPPGTKSFALICHDPDAPMGDWIHWLIKDIPAQTAELPAGGPLPREAREIINDFGYTRYGGPCPPSGEHRYYFILYALGDNPLGEVSKKEFRAKASQTSLASAKVMGTYRRR